VCEDEDRHSVEPVIAPAPCTVVDLAAGDHSS
jgi:hypothetical protein